MQPVNPKWLESGLVLVCERCFKERIPEEAPDVAERLGDFNLRDWLKAQLKEKGEWGLIRVISTTCMDVCAKGKVTVCLHPKHGDPANVIIVDPLEDREKLYATIVQTMGREA
jgi:predicted metal-binding protein